MFGADAVRGFVLAGWFVGCGVYRMASSILWSRLVLVTSLNSSRHSSFVGASMPMLP